MAMETVLRKRNRDGNKVCTVYGIPEPSYKFTLETCDDIEATIKDSKGLTVTILTPNAPTATISKKGNYNICIEGVGVGTVYAEYTSSSGGTTDCCDELREKDTDLQNQINNLRSRIVKLESQIGDNCCSELRNEINSLKTRVTNLENRLNNMNITGGTGISVTKNGDSYTITNTSPGGGGSGSDCCDELRSEINSIKSRLTTIEGNITNLTNRLNNQNITGGTGISVTKNGDSYTITNTSPNTDTNTVTTLVAGRNVTISDNGTGGNHVYTINAADSAIDTNTVTTLVPGTGVTITDSGTGGNHNYTISAQSPTLKQALNVTCDIGGISQGTTYAVGTSLETILRDLLNCTTPPQPTNDYPWFTSETVDRATGEERWIEFPVSASAGEHTFDLAHTWEEIPVKFDLPASLAPVTIYLFNKITNQWEVNTRDFATSNITRNINGETVNYIRHTDDREVNAIGRPVKIVWNP